MELLTFMREQGAPINVHIAMLLMLAVIDKDAPELLRPKDGAQPFTCSRACAVRCGGFRKGISAGPGGHRELHVC